ncbi:MAG: VCBS repeat-containing protein [bacterium]|nr:MAG: VCBS repeat-containing protein [bacterium]
MDQLIWQRRVLKGEGPVRRWKGLFLTAILFLFQLVFAVDVSAGFFDSGQTLGSVRSYGAAIADLDDNGHVDVFVANDGANSVWLNDGGGLFSDSGQELGSARSYGVALADLDGDGDADAFVANEGSGGNRVWLNDGAGLFSDSGQGLGGVRSNGVALADLDGDGDVDAFVANDGANRVWLNDGAGLFSDSGQELGDARSYGVALADLDGDGDVDAFLANDGDNSVWLNDGAGRFSDSGQELGGVRSNGVALADLDGDGDVDAFVANDGANRVWLNDGGGVFSDSGQNLRNDNSFGVALADLDGDGDPDAFNMNDRGNRVSLNDGGGVLSDSGLNLGNTRTYGGALADVDGDGDTDAIVANDGANRIWLNDHRNVRVEDSISPYDDRMVEFGSIPVNEESDSETVTLTNTGGADLTIGGIEILGIDADAFTLDPGDGTLNTCGPPPRLLAAGESCTVSVTFSPASEGTLDAFLDFSFDSLGSYSVLLVGQSTSGNTGGSVTIEDSTLPYDDRRVEYGVKRVNEESGTETVTLTNTGSVDLTIGGIEILGVDADAFTLDPGDGTVSTCGLPPRILAQGEACTVSVTFSPALEGNLDAVLDFLVDPPGSYSVLLVGESTSSTGGGSVGGCFIATAVFGGEDGPGVRTLRLFRDRFLLGSPFGGVLVRFYYRHSPPVADWLHGHGWAKNVLMMLLLPVIAVAWMILVAGPLMLPAMLILAGSVTWWLEVDRGRRARMR